MPFKIVRNDLTKMKVDAIVNTANPDPLIGDGTDRAVYEAAGADRLLEARRKIGKIGRGQAAITPAFGLNAKYIIHTVGPVWVDGRQGEPILLRSCYRQSLRLAGRYGCQSLAFPLISTGTYGFPRELALKIVNEVVRDFLDQDKRDMMIYLVVFDQESARISNSLYAGLASYIDDHYVREREKREYETDRALKVPSPYARRAIGKTNRVWREHSWPDKDEAWSDKSQALPGKTEAWSDETEDWPEESEILSDEKENWSEESETLSDEMESFSEKRASFSEETESWHGFYQKDVIEAPDFDDLESDDLDDFLSTSPGTPVQKKLSIWKSEKKTGKKRSLEDVLSHSEETFQTMLLRLIQEKGLTNPQVYNKANLHKKLFSKIKKDVIYHPKKNTAVALALALELNLDQTKDLIGRAGFALSPSSKFDLAISYFIENGIYDLFTVEELLFSHDLGTLSNY